jgi:hypothetical protein
MCDYAMVPYDVIGQGEVVYRSRWKAYNIGQETPLESGCSPSFQSCLFGCEGHTNPYFRNLRVSHDTFGLRAMHLTGLVVLTGTRHTLNLTETRPWHWKWYFRGVKVCWNSIIVLTFHGYQKYVIVQTTEGSILKGCNSGALHSALLCPWSWSIVRYSRDWD